MSAENLSDDQVLRYIEAVSSYNRADRDGSSEYLQLIEWVRRKYPFLYKETGEEWLTLFNRLFDLTPEWQKQFSLPQLTDFLWFEFSRTEDAILLPCLSSPEAPYQASLTMRQTFMERFHLLYKNIFEPLCTRDSVGAMDIEDNPLDGITYMMGDLIYPNQFAHPRLGQFYYDAVEQSLNSPSFTLQYGALHALGHWSREGAGNGFWRVAARERIGAWLREYDPGYTERDLPAAEAALLRKSAFICSAPEIVVQRGPIEPQQLLNHGRIVPQKLVFYARAAYQSLVL